MRTQPLLVINQTMLHSCVGAVAVESPVDALYQPPQILLLCPNGHDIDGPYAIVECPRCFRAFAQSLQANEDDRFQETCCEFCYQSIDYAVQHIRSLEATQNFERRLLVETA